MSQAIIPIDNVTLKERLSKATRVQRRRALLLTMPLVIFLIISFVLPIGEMLWRSVHNPTVSNVVPDFAVAIQKWDGQNLPSEAIFELFVNDLVAAKKNREIGKTVGNLATRINYDIPGSRSLFTSTARKATNLKAPFKESLIKLNKKWANHTLWLSLQRNAKDITPGFYVAALDLKYDDQGNVVQADELYQIYMSNFIKTLEISALITFICVLLAYPIAYVLSTLPLRQSNLLMILVLLPFWTSLLVRTTSWIAILQTEGLVNDIFVFLGILADDGRVQMIYNQTGTVIAMVHILLPFMILPLYSVMKTINPTYMKAALSMGAKQSYAMRRVYLPQTIPGLAAGTLLVFILAIGYYITPALVGGEDGILISNLIAYHIQKSLNWSLGAALSAILLGTVLILYWLYNKLIGIDNLKFG
ncbi:MAG: ABC transporter permease [Gammaproteobacteria bacterium]|nr:ABC transporter permease [Gammaproteobacteria bacterium]